MSFFAPKMVRIVLGVFLLMVLTACVKEEKPPEDLLPTEDMVEVLIHVHILEAKVENSQLKKDSIQLLYDRFEAILFEDMEVDRRRYELSMRYYANKPKALNEIYKIVVDSLALRAKNRDID